MKLLIIEDETDIAWPVKRFLEQQGYRVDYADNGKTGLQLAITNTYDCVLLDLNLPEIDGISIAKTLQKQTKHVPIIMLTARSQIYNKLEGFAVGSDDYVTKPFDLLELIARIRAVVKRNCANNVVRLTFGNFELFPEQNKIIQQQAGKPKEIIVSSKEAGVLEYLIRNQDRFVSTEELLEHVWDSEVDLFTDTVKTHMKTLRQKIDPDKTIIKTVRGKGYMITP
ncbi:MAG: response regulator transcription factor [Patescibacteria group bacterium]|jgi:DNA-binding response OmpR family regulator